MIAFDLFLRTIQGFVMIKSDGLIVQCDRTGSTLLWHYAAVVDPISIAGNN